MSRLLSCAVLALSITACKDTTPAKSGEPAPVAKPTPTTPAAPAPAAPTPAPAPPADAWKQFDLKTVKHEGAPGEWIVDAKVTMPPSATLAGESLGRGVDDLVEWAVVATVDGIEVTFTEAALDGAPPSAPTDRAGAKIEDLRGGMSKGGGWLMVAPFDSAKFTVGAAFVAPGGKRLVECTVDGIPQDKIDLATRICRSLAL